MPEKKPEFDLTTFAGRTAARLADPTEPPARVRRTLRAGADADPTPEVIRHVRA